MIVILNPDHAADTATQDAIALSTTIRNGHIAYAWKSLIETLEDDPVRVLQLVLLYAAMHNPDEVRSSVLEWVRSAA